MESDIVAPLKIFLVEDDPYLGRVYERAFKFAGYDVEWVADGKLALERLIARDLVPAAIVLDILLPSMNGYDLLREIRKNERYAPVPIIMLTNSFVEHDGDPYLAAGADAYLIKIDNQSKDVIQKVTDLINKGRAKAPGA